MPRIRGCLSNRPRSTSTSDALYRFAVELNGQSTRRGSVIVDRCPQHWRIWISHCPDMRYGTYLILSDQGELTRVESYTDGDRVFNLWSEYGDQHSNPNPQSEA